MTTSNSKPVCSRLITFLGKSDYKVTSYRNPNDTQQVFETKYVAEALTEFLEPAEVVVLATDDAWEFHGESFSTAIRSHTATMLRRVVFPMGNSQSGLWAQFDLLKNELRLPAVERTRSIALDITLGFRSAPFFCAGVLSFSQLVDEFAPNVSIYYGAFEAKQGNETDIWDITSFSQLITWSSSIMLLLKTGRADGLADATDAIGRSLAKQWSLGDRKGPAPNLRQLGEALGRFGGDLETVRTGSLLLGDQNSMSSVTALLNAIATVNSSADAIPPLVDVLDRIRSVIEPLNTQDRLSRPKGIQALKSLANLYWQMGRFAEAASTMREAYITQFATSAADCPGQTNFSKEDRESAELEWFKSDEHFAQEIAHVRNDIEHAGYNAQPMSPERIKSKIRDLIERLTAFERLLPSHDA